MSGNSRLLEIEKLLAREEEELREAQKMAEEIAPILNKLSKKDILNPVILKTKLAKLDKKYKDAVYALFRISVESGPDGSFMILSPRKILSYIKENS